MREPLTVRLVCPRCGRDVKDKTEHNALEHSNGVVQVAMASCGWCGWGDADGS